MPEVSDAAVAGGAGMELDWVARRAERLYEQGHLEVATRHPDHVQALLTLAHALRELGAFEDALRVLRRISQLVPDHINAQAAYALTLFFKEDWAQAWQAFDVRFKFPDAVPNVTL